MYLESTPNSLVFHSAGVSNSPAKRYESANDSAEGGGVQPPISLTSGGCKVTYLLWQRRLLSTAEG